MNIQNKIESLQKRSEEEKRMIAFWASLLVTVLIILIGIGNSKLINSVQSPEPEVKEKGFFSRNLEKISVGFKAISRNITE